MSDGFEIDFLAVGDGKRSGDAIAIRFGHPENYKIMIYDGGNQSSGEDLVSHIKQYYGTSRVDYVVNSHPDSDHASGLSIVLEKLEVGELWMHQPWNYSNDIRDYFKDDRITNESLARRLKEKMAAAYALEKIAKQKNITIREPFAGEIIGGTFKILSPSKDWYVHTLIPEFTKSPDQEKSLEENKFNSFFSDSINKIKEYLDENWDIENLREDVSTSAENESSIVIFGKIASHGILLMGDAGIRSLNKTADYAISIGINLPFEITRTQVPHHGSRHNISTKVMNKVFGEIKKTNSEPIRNAYASVGKGANEYPKSAVSNAFIRRGFNIMRTQGMSIRSSVNMPDREGWNSTVPTIEFSYKVESWD